MGNWWRCAVALLAIAILPAASRAQQITYTVNAGMPVTIQLVGYCDVSASDLNFGAYASNQDGPLHAQTVIHLQCSIGTEAEVALDAGTGRGNNTSRRKMVQVGGRDELEYDLYKDAGHNNHWGDKSGDDTFTLVTPGTPLTVPVYGKIFERQRVRDGTYSDVITVHVYF